MTLLGHDLVYWMNMNADIENTVKQCNVCVDYQQMQPCEKKIPYDIVQAIGDGWS